MAQVGRCGGEHRPDGVVELPDAGEPRRECHVGEAEIGRLDEHAGGVRSLGAGQGEWTGAHLAEQQAVEMSLAEAQTTSEATTARRTIERFSG